MKLERLEGIIPSRISCYELMMLLEDEYACTIGFWINVSHPPGGEISWTLYANGSGDIWDIVYPAGFAARALITESLPQGFYSAAWSTLLQLHAKFREANPTAPNRLTHLAS